MSILCRTFPLLRPVVVSITTGMPMRLPASFPFEATKTDRWMSVNPLNKRSLTVTLKAVLVTGAARRGERVEGSLARCPPVTLLTALGFVGPEQAAARIRLLWQLLRLDGSGVGGRWGRVVGLELAVPDEGGRDALGEPSCLVGSEWIPVPAFGRWVDPGHALTVVDLGRKTLVAPCDWGEN